MTDVTFGFDTALGIATEAIDRLHSTAHSHHRIVVVEIMGHRAGWLTLGAGIAGGADVILIPEIPYDVESIADAIRAAHAQRQKLQHRRRRRGRAVAKRTPPFTSAALEKREKAKAKDGKEKGQGRPRRAGSAITPATPCASPTSSRN